MNFTIALFVAAMLTLAWLALGTTLLKSRSAARAPFSLGRLQMAWWSVIILASFIGLATARHQVSGVMNRQTVIILALAAATLLGGPCVDRIAGAGGRQESRNFLADLACDGHGLCLHRLQFLVWNGALGLSFVWTVVSDASMPVFDRYTLSVLAISAATFVGFKAQERTRSTQGEPS